MTHWKLKDGDFESLSLANRVNAIAEGRAVKVDDTGAEKLTELNNEATEPPQWRNTKDIGLVMKYDSGKIRLELFPGDALYAISDILTYGAKKYQVRGWEKGMEWSRVFGALQRHLWAWWGGEKLDSETKKSHLWHAGCCIVFLIAYEIRNIGTDDRPGKRT